MPLKVLVGMGVGLLFAGIGLIFWQQELKYLTPTPVPPGYKAVAVAEAVELPAELDVESGKPVLLHFFNPDCPCSRFNTQHFISLAREYGTRVTFGVILVGSHDTRPVVELLQRYELQLPVVADPEHQLAERSGVYATPQAVLIDAAGKLYYRGNYNRSRYCTDRSTNYVQRALEALCQNEAPPAFPLQATTAWGCELPSQNSSFFYFLSL
jgi:peroxiredoxin